MMFTVLRAVILVSSAAGLVMTQQTVAQSTTVPQPAQPLYKQAKAPIDARAQDLLSRMTLEEKIAQLQGNSTLPPIKTLPVGPTPAFTIVNNKGVINEAVARRSLGNGVGVFALAGHGALPAADGVVQMNAIQSWVMANTRLGIPVMFHAEGLHGAVFGGGTSFPMANALGSTWNRALIRDVFGVVAKELRAGGVAKTLAPVFDLSRDPRYGRVGEMYGEDPYLVGEIGTAAVQGLQGSGATYDSDHVVATAKHLTHGQPESGTNTAPNDVSERTMREMFLPPFEKAIRVARLGAVMPSYNENSGGIPSHANSWLLKDMLRGEWGFTGVVDSDWFAVGQLSTQHHVATDLADAGVQAFNAGVDIESPNGAAFATLAAAVRDGRVQQRDIDAAVARVLTMKFRAGLFEQPLTDPKRVAATIGTAAHGRLARRTADEAIVLLKNQNALLPLDPKAMKRVAVIGPNADKQRLGGYSGTPPYFVTVVDGIRKRLGTKATVDYAQGVGITANDTDPNGNGGSFFRAPTAESDATGIASAVDLALRSDVVVLVLGDNETVVREAFSREYYGKPMPGDTDDLNLPGRQMELVRAVMKLGKPTIAVVLNGRFYSTAELSEAVPALLQSGYLGQETGNAVADVLFGDVNPSGRLSVSIARNVGQLPVFYNRKPSARLGYVFDDNTPVYPFGFGLSYTSFTYGVPTLDTASITTTGRARVSVPVTNAGRRAGAEVVQMYVHPKTSSVAQPLLRLAGFEKVALKPGQTTAVSFDVGPEQLAIWNRQMKRVVEPGQVEVMVGPSSAQTTTVVLDIKP